jgi:lipoprotein-anchoring transpeptidase ErfK/SrfK
MLRGTFLIYFVSAFLAAAAAAQETAAPALNDPPTAVSEILAAQVMLDRAGFSPGEIDGVAGANLRKTVSAFQKSRGLRVTGRVDDRTLQRLKDETGEQPILVTYVLSDSDVAGPFQPDIPDDLVEQSKLPSLSYQDSLEALAEKFHASPALLTRLNDGQTLANAGEQIFVPNVVPFEAAMTTKPAPAGGTRIVVTKRTRALTVEDEKGQVLFFAPVTTGSEHDPLPIGKWKVTGVQLSPAFHYNPDLFWDADPAHSKAKIPAGPNNPVGVAWIDINKPHWGIHGTPEPAMIGRTTSHGCVRMTNWDVRRVLDYVKAGTPVIFQ